MSIVNNVNVNAAVDTATLYESVKRNLQLFNPGGDGFQSFMFGNIPVSLCDISSKFREYRAYRRKISSRWDPKKCSPIIVRDLPSGHSFEVADGGKRVLAAIENGVSFLPALVSLSDEPLFSAKWFISQDDGKDAVTPVEKHSARIALGDETALRIERIFSEYGIRLDPKDPVKRGYEENIAVWSKYSSAYRIMNDAKLGEPCLTWIISVITGSGMAKDVHGFSGNSTGSLLKVYSNTREEDRAAVKEALISYLKPRCMDVVRSEAKAAYPYVDKRTSLFYAYCDIIEAGTGIKITGGSCSEKGPRISGPGYTYESSVREYLAEYPDATASQVSKALKISVQTARKHVTAIKAMDPDGSTPVQHRAKEATRSYTYYMSKFKMLDGIAANDPDVSDSQLHLMTGLSRTVIAKWKNEHLPVVEAKAKADAEKKALEEKEEERLKAERSFLLNHETFMTRDFMKANGITALSSANTRIVNLGCSKEAQSCSKAPITWRSPYFGAPEGEDMLRIRQAIGSASAVSVSAVSARTGLSTKKVKAYLEDEGYAGQDGDAYICPAKAYATIKPAAEDGRKFKKFVKGKDSFTMDELTEATGLDRRVCYRLLAEGGFVKEYRPCMQKLLWRPTSK